MQFRRALTAVRSSALASVVVTGGLLALAAPSAAAHDVLVSTDPAADATVPAEVSAVSLTFSGTPRASFSAVEVLGPDGRHHESGGPDIVDAVLRQGLAGPLADGAYTVNWRVVSGDGHPVAGTYRFTVAGGATAPGTDAPDAHVPGAPGEATETALTAAEDGGDDGGGSGAAIGGGVAGALALAAVAAWLLRRNRHADGGNAR